MMMTVQLRVRQWSLKLAGAATSQIVADVRLLHNTTIQKYNNTTIQQYNKLLAMWAAKKAGEGKESAKIPTDRSSCSTRCQHKRGDTWNLVHTDAQHLIFSPTNFKSYHFLQGPGQGKHFCVFSSCNASFASSYMGYSRIGMHKHSDWVNQI